MGNYFENLEKKKDNEEETPAVSTVVETVKFFGLEVGLDADALEKWKTICKTIEDLKPRVAKDIDNAKMCQLALDTFKSVWLLGKHNYLSVFQSEFVAAFASVTKADKKDILSWVDHQPQGFIPDVLQANCLFALKTYGFGKKTARLVELEPLAKASEKANTSTAGQLDVSAMCASADAMVAKLTK